MSIQFPSSPTDGQFYPTVNPEFVYNAAKTRWDSLPLEGAKTITSDVVPTGAQDGDQWFNTVTGVLYIWVVDVDGGQWVESQAPITANGYYSPNYIINGAFDIWQRGTSFGNGPFAYDADRWLNGYDGTIGGHTQSQLALSPGEIPGFDGAFARRWNITSAGSGSTYRSLNQRVEDVRTLAGRTVTVSFWAKADTNTRTITPGFYQGFGTGGSTAVSVSGLPITLSTSWTRYSQTLSLPSVSGKTIGANSILELQLKMSLNTTMIIDVTGVQLEEGNVATAFRRNANSIQGELAACQRYYWRKNTDGNLYNVFGVGRLPSSTSSNVFIPFPVQMRTTPSQTLESSIPSTFIVVDTAIHNVTAIAMDSASTTSAAIAITGSGFNAGGTATLQANATSSSYLAFSAEL